MDYSLQKEKTLLLKTTRKVTQVALENIIFIECDSYLLSYHLTNQDTPIIISDSLKKVEKDLIDYNFIRINRNQLINMRYLKSYDIKNKIITMANNVKLSVSRRKSISLKNSI